MVFPDKYNLTPEQNLFLAKKKWDENVYCGMRMENRAVTFAQVITILNGVNVPNVQLDDIQAILNMRDVWKFLFASVDEPVTLDYLCKLNEYIARNEALEWGKLHTGTVGISGTDYIPAIPSPDAVSAELTGRHLCHRKSPERLCVGRTGAVLLGWQQENQHDPGE